MVFVIGFLHHVRARGSIENDFQLILRLAGHADGELEVFVGRRWNGAAAAGERANVDRLSAIVARFARAVRGVAHDTHILKAALPKARVAGAVREPALEWADDLLSATELARAAWVADGAAA